ncbi:CheY-like superfamily [Cunninghamella echinulata]|nr:CheY-like superfamily [Cunninghamella echinulata]
MKKTLLTPPSSTSSSSSSTSNSSTITANTDISSSSLSSPLRILLVDDNVINLQLLKKIIQMNFNIQYMDIAYDGYEALQYLQHQLYDLILLDIDMPRLNGIETTRYIRMKSHQGTTTMTMVPILDGNRNTPIIAVTTNDSIEAIELYQQVGMDGCISKPVIPHQLKSQLLQFLENTLLC